MIEKIPITLLTGFLGSGKTTLLRQMLELAEWKNTVVLVNEVGEVGLDHHLLWGTGDAVVVLENGCICCSVRDDLVGVLEDLFWKRLERKIPRFTRVVIETTGLAYPGPILEALQANQLVAERYAPGSVLCTIDAVLGRGQLVQRREAVAQLACADIVLVTKTDLVDEAAVEALETAVRTVNPLAPMQRTGTAQILPALFQHDPAALRAPPPTPLTGALPLYHHRVQTLALRFSRPWRREEFERALADTLLRGAARILRIKGLVELEGEAGPMVVQAVQGMMFPPEQLPAWPGDERHSFIVCISTALSEDILTQSFRSHMELPNLM